MRNEELYEIPFSKGAVAFATGGCCKSDPTTLRQLRLRSLPPPLGKGGLDVCLFYGDSAQKMP